MPTYPHGQEKWNYITFFHLSSFFLKHCKNRKLRPLIYTTMAIKSLMINIYYFIFRRAKADNTTRERSKAAARKEATTALLTCWQKLLNCWQKAFQFEIEFPLWAKYTMAAVAEAADVVSPIITCMHACMHYFKLTILFWAHRILNLAIGSDISNGGLMNSRNRGW